MIMLSTYFIKSFWMLETYRGVKSDNLHEDKFSKQKNYSSVGPPNYSMK